MHDCRAEPDPLAVIDVNWSLFAGEVSGDWRAITVGMGDDGNAPANYHVIAETYLVCGVDVREVADVAVFAGD